MAATDTDRAAILASIPQALESCLAGDHVCAAQALSNALTQSLRHSTNLSHWNSLKITPFLDRMPNPSLVLVETLRLFLQNLTNSFQVRCVDVLLESWFAYRRDVLKVPSSAISKHASGLSEEALNELMMFGPMFPIRVWCRLIAALGLPVIEAQRLQIVRDLLQAKRFREATPCAISLGVVHRFSLEEMCLELVKVNGQLGIDIAWSAVKNRPELHDAFCRLLIVNSRETKVIVNYIKKCGLNMQDFPDLIFILRSKTLSWLIYEKKLLDFASMLLPIDPKLQTQCVTMLLRNQDWVLLRRLQRLRTADGRAVLEPGIIDSQTNEVLQSAQAVAMEIAAEQQEALIAAQAPLKYFHAPPPKGIFMADSMESLARAWEVLSVADVIGLDTEFSPTFVDPTATQTSNLAILQAATREYGVIFDMIAIQSSAQLNDEFSNLLGKLFADPKILKCGYGFGGDLKLISSTFPKLAECRKISSFLELQVLQDHLFAFGITAFDSALPAAGEFRFNGAAFSSTTHSSFEVATVDSEDTSGNHLELQNTELPPSSAASGSDSRRGGLSRLVEILLGKPLNKDRQMSNWNARPLSEAQLQYASLDAHCEVLLLDRALMVLQRIGSKSLMDMIGDL